MTITEQALAALLHNYFTTLEPVGKDVTLKNEMKKVAQPDGSTKVQMVPTKGDLYIPEDLSNAMSKAIAKAIWPNIGGVDTKSPQGTRLSGTTIGFGPRPGQPTTVLLTLSDSIQRSMTTGTWDLANGVADWGYDEAASQGNGKWLFFYAVPKTGDDTKLVIVSSDNDPSVGPTGRIAFKLVWVARLRTGTIAWQRQSGNAFHLFAFQFAASMPAGLAWNYAGTDYAIDDYVPATASEAIMFGFIKHTNTGAGNQIGMFVGCAGAQYGQVRPYVTGLFDTNSIVANVPLDPGLVVKKIRHRNEDWVGGGAGATWLSYQEVMVGGWVDEWIDP